MKVVSVNDTDLRKCIRTAQRERVVLTRKGILNALVLGIRGLNLEQVETGDAAEFWALLRERRAQKKLSREELEKRLADYDKTQATE